MTIEVKKIRELNPIDAEGMDGSELLPIEDNTGLLRKVRVDQLISDYENPYFIFSRDTSTTIPTHTITPRPFAGITDPRINIALMPAGGVDSVSGEFVGGGIFAQTPDGTILGGNERGEAAIDFQSRRTSADMVASGFCSAILSGLNNSNRGMMSVVLGGNNNNISAQNPFNFIGVGSDNIISGGTYFASILGGGGNILDNASHGAVIGGGQSNKMEDSAYCAVISGGAFNELTGNSSVVGGGYQNQCMVDFSTISGGGTNKILNGSYSTISGGSDNEINNLGGGGFSVISGGGGNKIDTTDVAYSSIYSNISGGADNSITNCTFAGIGSGSNNKIASPESNTPFNHIGGGNGNEILNSQASFIGSGYASKIINSSSASVVGGGNSNIIDGGSFHGIVSGSNNSIVGVFGSFIGGGSGNSITTTNMGVIGGGAGNSIEGSQFSGILSGASNSLIDSQFSAAFGASNKIESSQMSTVVGGGNSILKTNSSATTGHNHILGGTGNTIDNAQHSIILGGLENDITGSNKAMVFGEHNIATGNNSSVTGTYANDRGVSYSETFADGSSKRQRQNVFRSGSTTINTTPNILATIPVPVSSSYYFTGEVIIRKPVGGNTATLRTQVSVVRDAAGAATVDFTNTPFHTDAVSLEWSLDYIFDPASNSLQVRATSATAAAVVWITDFTILELEDV